MYRYALTCTPQPEEWTPNLRINFLHGMEDMLELLKCIQVGQYRAECLGIYSFVSGGLEMVCIHPTIRYIWLKFLIKAFELLGLCLDRKNIFQHWY
jgi:hypothetical protein